MRRRSREIHFSTSAPRHDELAAPAFQHRLVSGILHEGMLEAVAGARAARLEPEYDRPRPSVPGLPSMRPRSRLHRAKNDERTKITPDHRGNLRDLFRRSNRSSRAVRSACKVAGISPAWRFAAALEQQPRHLLDEQRHAARPGDQRFHRLAVETWRAATSLTICARSPGSSGVSETTV